MAIWKPDPRGFMEKNAGKLLVAAFLAPVPLRLLASAMGSNELWMLVLLIDLIILGMSITGYIQRGQRRKRESS